MVTTEIMPFNSPSAMASDWARFKHERDLLAEALGNLLMASNVVRPDAMLSGPELLLAAEMATEAALATAHCAANVRQSTERDRREGAWQVRWGELEARLEALGLDPGELHDWVNSDCDARAV